MIFSDSQILVLFLSALFLVALVAYSIYLSIYIRVRKSINKIYKYQEKYNEFATNSFSSAVKPFELLTRNKSSLQFLVKYMKNFDTCYKKELKKSLIPINELSDLKNHFDFKFTKESFAEIDYYFEILSNLSKHFSAMTNNSSLYQNSASKLIVTYRNLVDQISLFLKNHILNKHDSPIFKNFLANISKFFEKADLSYNNFQNSVFIKDMENLRKVIHSLLLCANNLYFIDKKVDYLQYLLKEIELQYNQFKNEKNVLLPTQLNEIYRIINESKDSIKKINSSLHLFQFKDAEVLANDLFNVLLPVKKHLYDENEARNIVKSGLKNFITSMNIFETKQVKLIQAIENVGKNFVRDKEITVKISKVEQTLLRIKETIKFMQIEKENRQQNYSGTLEKMKLIIDSISELKIDLDNLIRLLDLKMNIYKNVIYGINSLKLKYSQLENYMIDNNFYPSQKIEDNFRIWKDKINKKDQELYTNYNNAILSFDNFSKQANEQFIKTLKVIVELAAFKHLCELVFLFLNKYRREDPEIEKNLEKMEEVYKKGFYEECLKNLIKILQIIKNSAAKYNLGLS